jgi:hypothetical protein
MALESWYARLQAILLRSGEQNAVRLMDFALNACEGVTPIDVHLRQGDRAIAVPCCVQAKTGVDRAFAILATDVPGVRARLAYNNTDPNVRSNGYLVRANSDITSQVQDGTVTPAYTAGQFVNHEDGSGALYDAQRAIAITDDYQWPAGVVSTRSKTGGGPTGVINYVFGPGDPQNLGNPNDGKIFSFYCRNDDEADGDNGHVSLEFASSPWWSDATDAYSDVRVAAGDGDTDDFAAATSMVVDQIAGGHWGANFEPQLLTDKWSFVQLAKRDFTSYQDAGPDGAQQDARWDKIVQVRWNYYWYTTGAYTARVSSLYFGDPPDSEVNSIALIERPWEDDKPIVLSLDAPTASHANVKGLVFHK